MSSRRTFCSNAGPRLRRGPSMASMVWRAAATLHRATLWLGAPLVLVEVWALISPADGLHIAALSA